ncbi:MAG: Fic family protein [Clostridia bacterium]|nr:Fic family protein [Clostridia bacterium]
MGDLMYCYPDSDVLKNKLGIVNQEKFHEVERKLTAIRINDLIRKPYRGRFDLDHLRGIHFYIFQDLYTWAGELRKVDIAKGNMFCRAMFLENQSDVVFSAIRRESYLEGLAYEQFVKRLAYHFSEINALHPFREGNGRTQREFIRELALYNHFAIDFSKVARQEMLDASVDAFLCKYERMEALFDKCLRKLK